MRFERKTRLRWLSHAPRPGLYLVVSRVICLVSGYEAYVGDIVWSPFKGYRLFPFV